ncbi:hypothetical protein BH10CYA1_BH10CYA1_41710 [soil metagenome]
MGGTLFVFLFGLICFFAIRATESVINHDEDSPLAVAFSPEMLQAAFDKEKQPHLLSAEFKIIDGEKAAKEGHYEVGHKAYAIAVDELSDALGAGSPFTRMILLRAGAFEGEFNRWKVAQNYFEGAIKEPMNAGVSKSFPLLARRYLVQSLAKQGLYEQEAVCCRKILALAKVQPGDDDSDLIYAFCGLGRALLYTNTREALNSLNQAISIIQKQKRIHRNDERDADVYVSRGCCLFILQRYAECVADLNAAAEFGEYDITAEGYRGCALCRLGKSEEAVRVFDRALQEKSKPAWIYYLRGRAFSQLKEHQKAIDDFKSAATLSTNGSVVVPPEGPKRINGRSLKEAANQALEKEELFVR